MSGILWGILLIGGGIAVLYYHRQLYEMFGDIQRAEKALGDSRAVYPLIGAIMIVFGVVMLFTGGPSSPLDSGLDVTEASLEE